MKVRRSLWVLLVLLLALVLLLWVSWVLVSNRLSELGIEKIEASGLEVGWDHVGFRDLAFTWSGAGRTMRVESTGPSVHLDWGDWQVARLSTRQATVTDVSLGNEDGAPSSSDGAPAVRLTLPENIPFWLPRTLTVNHLMASFPCGAGQCRLEGELAFDRGGSEATLKVDATLNREAVEPLEIRGDLRLGAGGSAKDITGGEFRMDGLKPWLRDLFPSMDQTLMPVSARLELSPSGLTEESPDHWSGNVSVETEGGAGLGFDGQLTLNTESPWALRIREGLLTGRLSSLQHSGWLFDDIRAHLPLAGSVSAARTRLTLGQGAELTVRYADLMETDRLVWLDGLSLSGAGLELTFENGPAATGPLELSVREATLPGLIPQPWQANGQVRLQGQAIAMTGLTLSSEAGTIITSELDYHSRQGLDARFSMKLEEANQANYLAGTLEAWPKTLTFSGGHADLTAGIRWLPDEGSEMEGTLVLAAASGLYDRMAWEELEGSVSGRWGREQVSLNADELALETLNPGVAIGPVQLGFQYEADTEAPMAGQLHLDKATAGFAGGMVKIDENRWSLAKELWRVPLIVEGIELSALMNLYPAEGLSGDGILQGRLPVLISANGIRIEGGEISALAPGGTLQLPADRLRGLGQGNAAMDLVARAMEDFHYRVLDSSINYAEDGALTLDLHLEGSSPQIESERPVVLNINLEENIPALLTSLQLSGRVNDAVTERVRRMLEQGDVSVQ
ncbi:Dicarboxylate transport [Marinobacter daqiaonensis]|uniref:Dicarboxylate transport n=1 Tax=Marinobacter daqiaonensis TaxID=650891 RepID=A0A1I6IC88_9GAMM|nr:YdbH domain-containing protein [Marinobacter daqiaonensis]SFR64296.1 Dicarboxylate transport [Marinobacter daqiaonensis]